MTMEFSWTLMQVMQLVLTSCITPWSSSHSVSHRTILQHVVRTAKKVIWVSLPSIQDIYKEGCRNNALYTFKDCPSHGLFDGR